MNVSAQESESEILVAKTKKREETNSAILTEELPLIHGAVHGGG